MSKPLTVDPGMAAKASKYHAEVFKFWGYFCVLCHGKAPATDAAHVIPRSKLGPLRYADVHFARPAHRKCHELQEAGKLDFSLEIGRAHV